MPNQYTSPPLIERFWLKVDVYGFDDCWEWNSHKNTYGYGLMRIHGKHRLATHVLFYLRKSYWPPKGRTANHHCDNPGCLNPKHLYLGTKKSNARDREQRCRGNHSKGEQNGQAKLTERQVHKIKRLVVQGNTTQAKMGKMFGVSQSTISVIVNSKQWRHI